MSGSHRRLEDTDPDSAQPSLSPAVPGTSLHAQLVLQQSDEDHNWPVPRELEDSGVETDKWQIRQLSGGFKFQLNRQHLSSPVSSVPGSGQQKTNSYSKEEYSSPSHDGNCIQVSSGPSKIDISGDLSLTAQGNGSAESIVKCTSNAVVVCQSDGLADSRKMTEVQSKVEYNNLSTPTNCSPLVDAPLVTHSKLASEACVDGSEGTDVVSSLPDNPGRSHQIGGCQFEEKQSFSEEENSSSRPSECVQAAPVSPDCGNAVVSYPSPIEDVIVAENVKIGTLELHHPNRVSSSSIPAYQEISQHTVKAQLDRQGNAVLTSTSEDVRDYQLINCRSQMECNKIPMPSDGNQAILDLTNSHCDSLNQLPSKGALSASNLETDHSKVIHASQENSKQMVECHPTDDQINTKFSVTSYILDNVPENHLLPSEEDEYDNCSSNTEKVSIDKSRGVLSVSVRADSDNSQPREDRSGVFYNSLPSISCKPLFLPRTHGDTFDIDNSPLPPCIPVDTEGSEQLVAHQVIGRCGILSCSTDSMLQITSVVSLSRFPKEFSLPQGILPKQENSSNDRANAIPSMVEDDGILQRYYQSHLGNGDGSLHSRSNIQEKGFSDYPNGYNGNGMDVKLNQQGCVSERSNGWPCMTNQGFFQLKKQERSRDSSETIEQQESCSGSLEALPQRKDIRFLQELQERASAVHGYSLQEHQQQQCDYDDREPQSHKEISSPDSSTSVEDDDCVIVYERKGRHELGTEENSFLELIVRGGFHLSSKCKDTIVEAMKEEYAEKLQKVEDRKHKMEHEREKRLKAALAKKEELEREMEHLRREIDNESERTQLKIDKLSVQERELKRKLSYVKSPDEVVKRARNE